MHPHADERDGNHQSQKQKGWASNFNDSHFPLLIMWGNYNYISMLKPVFIASRCMNNKPYRFRVCKICWTPHKYLVFIKDLQRSVNTGGKNTQTAVNPLWTPIYETWSTFFSTQAVRRSKCSSKFCRCTVYDPQHKRVNAGEIKCLWPYFRHLLLSILSTDGCWVLEKGRGWV